MYHVKTGGRGGHLGCRSCLSLSASGGTLGRNDNGLSLQRSDKNLYVNWVAEIGMLCVSTCKYLSRCGPNVRQMLLPILITFVLAGPSQCIMWRLIGVCALVWGGLGYSGIRAGPAVSPLLPLPWETFRGQMRMPVVSMAMVRASLPIV